MTTITSNFLLPNYNPEEVGLKGEKGDNGQSSFIHIAYSNSSDGGVDFSTTDASNRAFIGSYSDFEMIDSSDHSKYEWQRVKGDTGKDGIAGKDGVGLSSTVITYAASTSASVAPSSEWNTQVPTVAEGSYLWTKTVWNYTDSTSETGYSVARMGADGDRGQDGIAGKDGVGIKTTLIEYAVNTSGTVRPTTGWATSIPNTPEGQYLWTRTKWTYTDNTTETGYSVAKQGAKGATGSTGATGPNGVGIASTIIEYNKSTSSTTKPTTGWTSAIPSISGGEYLWTRTTLNYTNSTKAESYTVSRQGQDGSDGQLFTGEFAPASFNEGDLWYKVVSGKVTAVFKATNGQWIEVPFDSSVIAETIVGKTIQASHLTGSTIDGGSISGAEFLNEYTDVTTGVNQVSDGALKIENGILQAGSSYYLTDSAGTRLYKFGTTEADIHQGSVNLIQKLYDDTGVQTSQSSASISGGLITLSLGDASGNYMGVLDAKALTNTPWVNLRMGSLWETAENNPPQYRIVCNLDGSRTIKFRGQVKLKSGTMSPGNTYLPFSQSNKGGPHYLPDNIKPQTTAFAYAPVGVSSGTMYGGQWAVTSSGWFSVGVAQSNTTYAVLTSISYDIV